MAIESHITNQSDGKSAKVTKDGALRVTHATFPPIEDDGKTLIFRQYFTEDGLPSGLADMRVNDNGRRFIIPADVFNERYIKTISFVISDAAAPLNEFGDIGTLTNGIRFFYENTVGRVIIHGALKTNFDFIRLCMGRPAFTMGNNPAFRLTNAIGTSETYMPVFDFADFGLPMGLHLKAGTKQKIIIEINDDLTALDGFDAIAYGFDRIPD